MKQESLESVMPRVNPGDSLRDGREARGLSVAEAASQLNLSVARLQQLEAGEFDKLPGHTFARGYVRSYARLLGLDPNRIVLEFDQFTGTDAAGSEVHTLGQIEQPVRVAHSLLRLLSFVLLLAFAGLGFYWWQERSTAPTDPLGQAPVHIEVEGADGRLQLHPLTELEDEALLAAEADPLPLDSHVLPVDGQSAAPLASDSVPVAPAQAEASAAAVAPSAAPQPAAPETAAPATPTAQAEAAAPAAGQGIVEVVFSDTCWVQVKDADGKVLAGGLKRKGENLRVVGKAPLELRLGVARAASVSYNGSPVDIAPFTSNETARLSLGQ